MITHLRLLTGHERTLTANRRLGRLLAFVAGAVNAGGFVALARYTSHMTGVVTSVAVNAAAGDRRLVAAGICAYASFLTGAAACTLLINYSRRHGLRGLYALPLLLESCLLAAFAVYGRRLDGLAPAFGPAAALVLCFAMGAQNAVITKISNAEIRTTHMTGLTTDLGIELGRLFYWNRDRAVGIVRADRDRMALFASLILLFLIGGLFGALAFERAGFLFALAPAAILLLVAAVPLWDDLACALGAAR